MPETSVEQIAAVARDGAAPGGDVDAVLRDLRGTRRWELDAAYATARRRGQDHEWARAADLLELAIAQRHRRATDAPGRWPAAGVALWVRALLGVGYTALALQVRSWFFALLGLLYVAVSLAAFVALRRAAIQVPETPEGVGTIISRANAVAAAAASPPADDAQAVEQLRWVAAGRSAGTGPLDRRLAAFALAQAQRQVSASLGVGRRRALTLIDRARREALAAAQLPEAR